jgi:hypothetical protein
MTARSRPRARIVALKVAARFAPEAVMITRATAVTPIPGKTTTMRMLVGLSEPDSGYAQILGGATATWSWSTGCVRSGRTQPPLLPSPGRRVGILLDASAQHAGRRGRPVPA